MNIKELRDKTEKELKDLLKENKSNLIKENQSLLQSKEKNLKITRNLKKDIARVQTVLKEKAILKEISDE